MHRGNGRFAACYHRAMLPKQERLRQFARLVGYDAYLARVGSLDATEPDPAAIHSLVDERCDEIAAALVAEAAASDDVISPETAQAYVDDRLRMLDDLITPEQAERLLTAFIGKTSGW
jgi:hypothetical protein